MISAAAKKYRGPCQSRDFSVTFDDLNDVSPRIHGDDRLSEDDAHGIRLMRPPKFKNQR